jgi:hypothetical protein
MPNPFLKWTCALSLLLVIIAVIYAMLYSHFVPSALGHQIALCAATVFGTGGVILAFRPLPSRTEISGTRRRMLQI